MKIYETDLIVYNIVSQKERLSPLSLQCDRKEVLKVIFLLNAFIIGIFVKSENSKILAMVYHLRAMENTA